MDLPGAHSRKDCDRETSRGIWSKGTRKTRHERIGSGAESWSLERICDSEDNVVSGHLVCLPPGLKETCWDLEWEGTVVRCWGKAKNEV